MMKKIGYWWVAIGITLALSIYQRMTGPTYPKKVDIELRGESYQIKLPRSGVQKDEIITLKGIPQALGEVNHGDCPHDLRSAAITGQSPRFTTAAFPRRTTILLLISNGKTMSGRQRCPYSPLQGNWSITSQSMARTI